MLHHTEIVACVASVSVRIIYFPSYRNVNTGAKAKKRLGGGEDAPKVRGTLAENARLGHFIHL